MFDLEESIAKWGQQMLAAGITQAELEELEIHLRDEFTEQNVSDSDPHDTFATVVRSFGTPRELGKEFKKIPARSAGLAMAWAAWVLFVVSFFLPALVMPLAP